MNRIFFLILFFLTGTLQTFGQGDYLERGNAYLDKGQFDKEEQIPPQKKHTKWKNFTYLVD